MDVPLLVLPRIGLHWWHFSAFSWPAMWWGMYYVGILLSAGLGWHVLLPKLRAWRAPLAPVGVVSLILLASSASFVIATVADQGAAAAQFAPTGAVSMTYTAKNVLEWKGSSVWMAPTVMSVRGAKPNLLVFGIDPAPGSEPEFVIWASGDGHQMKALGRSCSSSSILKPTDANGSIVGVGLRCRIAPESKRETAGILDWLPEGVAPVVIEMGGSSPTYSWTWPMGQEGTRYQVGLSAYMSDASAFENGGQTPIDELDLEKVGVGSSYLADIGGSPAAAVSGSPGSGGLFLGAGYEVLPGEYVSHLDSSRAVQVGPLVIFYGSEQSTPRAWIADWSIRMRSGAQIEPILQMLALVVLGAAPVVSFGQRRQSPV